MAAGSSLDEHTALVQAAQSGDRDALTRLLTPLVVPVLCLVRAKVPPDDAEDVAQNVLESVVIGLPLLREPEHFVGWLRSIVRNEIANYHRRRRDVICVGLFVWSAGGDDGQAAYGRAEDRALIESILSAVTDRQQEALRLWAEDGLSYEEIGEYLGTSWHAAENLIWRGKCILRHRREFSGV